MVHKQLSKEEQDVIYECMTVLATTHLIADWEFSMRVSYTKQDILALTTNWPRLEGFQPVYVNAAINNCLNEVAHAFSEEWVARYNLSRPQADAVFRKWRDLKPTLPEVKIPTDEEVEQFLREVRRNSF